MMKMLNEFIYWVLVGVGITLVSFAKRSSLSALNGVPVYSYAQYHPPSTSPQH